MLFTPLNGHVVIREQDAERTSRGGIVLPDSAQKKSCKGTVVAVYEPYEDPDGAHDPKVNPGDVVLFPKYAGEEFSFDGEKVMLLKESLILGICRESETLPLPAKVDLQSMARKAYAEGSS